MNLIVDIDLWGEYVILAGIGRWSECVILAGIGRGDITQKVVVTL